MMNANQARSLTNPNLQGIDPDVATLLAYAELCIREAARNGDSAVEIRSPYYSRESVTYTTTAFRADIYSALRAALKQAGYGVDPEYAGKHIIRATWHKS